MDEFYWTISTLEFYWLIQETVIDFQHSHERTGANQKQSTEPPGMATEPPGKAGMATEHQRKERYSLGKKMKYKKRIELLRLFPTSTVYFQNQGLSQTKTKA